MDLTTYLAGDMAEAHPGVSVKSTVLLLKKKKKTREGEERRVLTVSLWV